MRLIHKVSLPLIALLSFSLPAAAHDLLIDIDPAPGATVEQANFEAKLTFNNPLLVVEGESNAEVSTKLVGSDTWTDHEISIVDNLLTAKITLSEAGDYDLRWKVVSSDGHPISGESKFTFVSEQELDSNTEQPLVIAPSPVKEESNSEPSWVGFYIGLAMVILGVIFAPIGLVMRRRAKKS